MSFKDFDFTLTEAQKKEREALIEALLKDPMVKEFLKTSGCSSQIVVDNAFRFKDWLMGRMKAARATEADLRRDPSLGTYVDLVYDAYTNTLQEVYVQTESASRVLAEMRYLDQYQIFPLPKQFESVTFEGIQYSKEGATYINATLKADGVTTGSRGLYLYGSFGVGKSYIAACLANKLAKEGKRIVFVTNGELLAYMKMTFGVPYEQDKLLRTLMTCDLLVLDDVGSEPVTPWSRDEVLFPLLNARMENKRLTVFTSNYALKDLEQVYATDSKGNKDPVRAARLVDRIQTLADAVEIVGTNRRIQK